MAAGQGFKTFANGDILTAADVNGYLMQNVWVFASTAARDAAVTSPQQGNMAYTKDTNTIWKYTGSAWTNIDTTGTSPLTTKGDIYGFSTTNARIPVGTNGQVLTADSTAGLGVSWQTPASSGGMTLLATTTTPAGATSFSFSSISQSYKHLLVTWDHVITNGSGSFYFNINDDTANHLWADHLVNNTSSTVDVANAAYWQYFNTPNNSTPGSCGNLWIYNYASTTRRKPMESAVFGYSTANSALRGRKTWGSYDATTAVTKINVTSTVNFYNYGEFKLWGVN